MRYLIEPLSDGRHVVSALRPVEIAVVADEELAKILVEALERRASDAPAAEEQEAPAAPDPSAVAVSVAAEISLRPAAEQEPDADEPDWETACARIAAGEKLGVLADELDIPMFTLRGKYAAWQRYRKAAGEDAPPSEEQIECATCGKAFVPASDGGDTCARCRRV